MPARTELNEDALDRPTEFFHSEVSQGHKSYLVNLGDLAFSSPGLFGGSARRAGLSCASCHVNGASNAKLFVPGMSTHPGNFDTTGGFFNPRADDGVLDPLTIPSLRGARYLAPYGHDGRIASLREFIRNVIVNEFAGSEPSPAIVDAIVTYLQDIDFLPNPLIGVGGTLTDKASEVGAPRRSAVQQAFLHPIRRSLCASLPHPFRGLRRSSPARCRHAAASSRRRLCSMRSSTRLISTTAASPISMRSSLISTRRFALGLACEDRRDLVAYLSAIGDGVAPVTPDGVDPRLKEVRDFSSVLATAIPAQDKDVIALAADTIGGELREFSEHFPDRFDKTVSGGEKERATARLALKELVLSVRKLAMSATMNDFAGAASEYTAYNERLDKITPSLKAAEPWSLFNPAVHDAHYAGLREMVDAAGSASHASE